MKKLLKSSLAVLLVLTLVSSFSMVMAAETEKQHFDYGSYVLLGDSVACGWSDIEERDTSFTRVEGSYGAFIADDLGIAPENFHPRACIGFRTLEMRYMLEDDYEGDRFMFYSIDQDRVDREIPAIRQEIAEAGLITLNVGGNDWGSYVGWHVYEEMDKFAETNKEFVEQAREYLETNGTDATTVQSLIDIASLTGSLPQLIKILPGALKEGFERFVANWEIVIQDIYAINPDATLVVVGMFDTALQDESMNGASLFADDTDEEATAAKISVGQAIVDFANSPMKENAEKYGYIFIDPVGTKCEKQHPSRAGHRHIADLILEALPDAAFPYTDVNVKSAEYKAIETLYKKQIMTGTTETTFAPDEALTIGVLKNALAKIAGTEATSTNYAAAKRLDVISAIMTFDEDTDFMTKLKVFGLALEFFINNFKFNFLDTVTRAEGAKLIYDYINL